MLRLPPQTTLTDTLCPYTTLFRYSPSTPSCAAPPEGPASPRYRDLTPRKLTLRYPARCYAGGGGRKCWCERTIFHLAAQPGHRPAVRHRLFPDVAEPARALYRLCRRRL